ncbi:Uncharacterized protein Fot_02945 [Forsythia ovata]|uniref:Uncharacterized protein n=1 Tax=Forsythia ovata TaxID=205694 RepID=A0ABD1X8B0_9LAMI
MDQNWVTNVNELHDYFRRDLNIPFVVMHAYFGGKLGNIWYHIIVCMVRQYAPLNKIWWKDVTDAEKSPMYSRLENVFVLDYDKRPWIKEVIENDMPIHFNEFRYELHEYYETLIDLPMAERKAKKHDQVLNQDY